MSHTTWTPIKNKANPLYGLSYEEVLQELQQNGFALQYVQVQTPELCMAAVQEYGFALQYVHDKFIHLFEQ